MSMQENPYDVTIHEAPAFWLADILWCYLPAETRPAAAIACCGGSVRYFPGYETPSKLKK